ncbi:DUF2776 family protein [Salinibacterium hongtaonis]|uniref:DUF2776 family protein n=1 Tax=Homoserinimonas hongtaonis TaxID=2079791 RepID=UPI000D3D02E5|nr:DUF2776 family protein [Salinibacterium hongtaonis]AWB89375.1 DUF2776 domain-containing protein [Salinibacterium hongtaonis]
MNYTVSVIFRAIPLMMMAVCVGYGLYVWNAADSTGNFVAGRVVTALGIICLCLFCTAATIIRQLIGRYTSFDRFFYPSIGYLAATAAVIYGTTLFIGATNAEQAREYVAGHVIFGVGLVSGCVATVATASTKFSLIPVNAHSPANDTQIPSTAFRRSTVLVLSAIPIALAFVAWVVAITNLVLPSTPERFTVGHVVGGLAMICTSLIGLVLTILHQVQKSYSPREQLLWPVLVIAMGSLSLIWGIILLVLHSESYFWTPGFVMIGLGLVCFSILSKVGLLALVWRRTFPLANRVPLLPITTALACLFLAAFLFQAAVVDSNVFIAAHVLVGLGAICFSLYSIVSILESGTSSAG